MLRDAAILAIRPRSIKMSRAGVIGPPVPSMIRTFRINIGSATDGV
jgi:hypothetical protein